VARAELGATSLSATPGSGLARRMRGSRLQTGWDAKLQTRKHDDSMAVFVFRREDDCACGQCNG